MNRMRKGIAFLAVLALVWQECSFGVQAADIQYRVNVRVVVDGVDVGTVAAIEDTYANNLYLSLKGLAWALKGTEKSFVPVIEKRKISITSGEAFGEQYSAWEQSRLSRALSATSGKYELYLDGGERKYYSFILSLEDGYDAFLTPVSLAMMFDMDMTVEKGRIGIRTDQPFDVSVEELVEAGYMQGVNALLIGDGTTGEIFFQYDGDEVVPIASTTKLMTYLVFMDAVAAGERSLNDRVTISEKASVLSVGSDGVMPMERGTVISMSDLLYGMLLLSSNECALAIAEHTAGSEEAFVERMNARAAELGLENAVFYNCHGLPVYEEQLIPAKIQNHMTAGEMFVLASAIMEHYPQVTDITAAKSYYMSAMGMDVKNNNALVYNLRQAVGLKTGTTNKAGACLVTCVRVPHGEETHDLIVVLFGADGDANRGILSELSARYAIAALQENRAAGQDMIPLPGEDGGIPANPETVVSRLIGLLQAQ